MRTAFIAIVLCLLATSTVQAQYRSQASVGVTAQRSSLVFELPGASPLSRLFSDTCEDDRLRGREAASGTHSGSGWMLGGLASGLVLGLIGTGIMYAVASSSSSEVERVPDGVDASCFRAGYTAKAKS